MIEEASAWVRAYPYFPIGGEAIARQLLWGWDFIEHHLELGGIILPSRVVKQVEGVRLFKLSEPVRFLDTSVTSAVISDVPVFVIRDELVDAKWEALAELRH